MRAIVGVTVSAVLLLAACNDSDSAKDRTSPPPAPSSPAAPPSTTAQSSTPPTAPTSAPPATSASQTPSAGSGTQPAQGKTTEAAVQRYEQYLHALGREDITTVCEIAGPGAKKAEAEGAGPCTSSFAVVFRMISASQKKSLQSATVDPKRVSVRPSDKVLIPAAAIQASTTFTSSDIGDRTLQYLGNAWYVVD
ncbi:hypothetical protein OG948_49255 (plasmid) [Embleya sp. NBC_00888]|uniref:hypothetical protein n=1 Tax=Embleya sp. NBC_00888 TaxID=2975960 RepID=UPI002F91A412|nr:hypothetical protein OG948_49255 [Embleya sp. NBC_00888]